MKLEIVRHIDDLGRICIPKDFRIFFGITPKTDILIEETENGIVLRLRNGEEKPQTRAQ